MASASMPLARACGATSPATTGPRPVLDVSRSYREQAQLVWRVLRHLGVPASQAEDAVHDVFLVVSRRASEFDASAPVRPWLIGIARRVAMDYRKLSRRRQRRRDAFGLEFSGARDDGGLRRAEAAQLVRRLLMSLPERKRLVLVLSDLEGWTGPEISTALTMSVNTVYTRLASARRQLERLAAQVGPVEGDA